MDSRKSILYSNSFLNYSKEGSYKLGALSSDKFRGDAQYIIFQMSRYKHASRLLSNKKKVIDIGVGDGIGLPILFQYFESVTATDIDEHMLNHAKECLDEKFKCEFILNNFYENCLTEKYDAAFSFDVLSLLDPSFEDSWMKNVCSSLNENGVLVIGSQNKNTVQFGDPQKHVDQPNFKTYDQLNSIFDQYFQNVLILSMNDETIHSGKRDSSQYFMAFGFSPKR